MVSIVVNARFLTQRVTGVQRYAIEVGRRLKRLEPAIRFVAPHGIIHPDLANELGVQVVGRLRGHAWEQLELPRHLAGAGLVSLCNAAPMIVSRQIATIHDAAPFSVPQAYSSAFATWYRFLMRRVGTRARGIATVSLFSAGELERQIGIAPDKISVAPNGHEHVFAFGTDEGVLDRHGLRDRRYLLAVGSRSPHKNFAALLRAAEAIDDPSFVFVVAGGADPRVHAASENPLDRHIVHVGAVSDAELRTLYEHAQGYVHPAYYEGFGLPPLEAMALGCPVLASRAASLPEVAGDAACYFDPFDDADIAAAIRRFMHDGALRADLRVRGLERAKRFTWDRCASDILSIAQHAFA